MVEKSQSTVEHSLETLKMIHMVQNTHLTLKMKKQALLQEKAVTSLLKVEHSMVLIHLQAHLKAQLQTL